MIFVNQFYLLLMVTYFFVASLPDFGNSASSDNVSNEHTKEFYYIPHAIYFEQALTDCEENYAGTLATIETKEDVEAVKKLLRGYPKLKIWIGLVPVDEGVKAENCFQIRPQVFDQNCWSWLFGNTVDPNVITWSSSTREKFQSYMYRGVLDLRYGTLEIDVNNQIYGYLCQRDLRNERDVAKIKNITSE